MPVPRGEVILICPSTHGPRSPMPYQYGHSITTHIHDKYLQAPVGCNSKCDWRRHASTVCCRIAGRGRPASRDLETPRPRGGGTVNK